MSLYDHIMWMAFTLVMCVVIYFSIKIIICFKMLIQSRYALPKLYYKEGSSLAKFLIENCKLLSQPYIPPLWGTNGHFQTFYHELKMNYEFPAERQYLQMKDKGIIALDWYSEGIDYLSNDCPVIILLPGWTGNYNSLTFLCKMAVSNGMRPVVFNKRGYGETPLTTPKFQSFCDTNDLREAIIYIKSSFTKSKIVACGLSTGSALLVSYLGDYGSSSHLSASVCISLDYHGSRSLSKNDIKQPYNFLILTNLKRLLFKHSSSLEKVIDIKKAMACKTIPEFEKNVFAKFYNLSSMKQYWKLNDPLRGIDDAATPLLCINSMDDPISNRSKAIPFKLFSLYPHFMLVHTKYGGHCGFIEKQTYISWAEKLAISYLKLVLKFIY